MEPVQWKYFAVGHHHHVYCNPLSADRMEAWIALLDLPEGARVTDIACGKAELLCRIAERYDRVRGTGVDLSPFEVPAARRKVAARGLEERVTIVQGDGAEHREDEGSQALCCCIGASWIWNGHRSTLEALARWTTPGGLVAVGEPYWLRPPPSEYLAHAGFAPEAWGTHEENVLTGIELGLRPVYAWTSSQAEWDDYEWMQQWAIERWARAHPDDPDAPVLLEKAEWARHAYLRWGRDHVGFGLYLFRKP